MQQQTHSNSWRQQNTSISTDDLLDFDTIMIYSNAADSAALICNKLPAESQQARHSAYKRRDYWVHLTRKTQQHIVIMWGRIDMHGYTRVTTPYHIFAQQ